MLTYGEITGRHSAPIKYKEDASLVLNDCLIGVEIELEDFFPDHENSDYLKHSAWDYWKTEHDGSLRGAGAIEFVLRQPLAGASLVESLGLLENLIKTYSMPECSERTSVHIHLNACDLDIKEIRALLALYYSVEPLLFNYVGGDRKNNIYCVPGESLTSDLLNFSNLAEDSVSHIMAIYNAEDKKYSALNLAAMNKFGSLEFRHKGGAWRTYDILHWINIILCIKKYVVAGNVIEPAELPSNLSCMGEDSFVNSVFQEFSDSLKYPGFERDVRTGVRTAQLLLYGDAFNDAEEYLIDRFAVAADVEFPGGSKRKLTQFIKSCHTKQPHAYFIKQGYRELLLVLRKEEPEKYPMDNADLIAKLKQAKILDAYVGEDGILDAENDEEDEEEWDEAHEDDGDY